jgi:hypothetical protein
MNLFVSWYRGERALCWITDKRNMCPSCLGLIKTMHVQKTAKNEKKNHNMNEKI